MLLCLSRTLSILVFGRETRWFGAVLGADKTGMSHSGYGGKALIRSRSAGLVVPRGRPADRSQASGCGSRFTGQAAPGSSGSAGGGAEVGIDLAGDVALQAADDFFLGFSFGCAAFGVGAGSRVRAQAGEHDPPQGVVGLAVAAGVEPAADGLARGCRDRGGAAQVRPGGLAAQPFWVVPGCDEQQRCGVGADPVESQKPGGADSDERADELVEALELAVEELRAPSQLAQRDAGGVADGTAGPGAQRGQPGDQGSGGLPGEAGPQVIGAGQDQGPGLVDGLGTLRLRRCAWRPSARGSPRPRRRGPWTRRGPGPTGPARAALTASSGSDLPWRRRSCRSERSTSTTRTPAVVMWRARPAP